MDTNQSRIQRIREIDEHVQSNLPFSCSPLAKRQKNPAKLRVIKQLIANLVQYGVHSEQIILHKRILEGLHIDLRDILESRNHLCANSTDEVDGQFIRFSDFQSFILLLFHADYPDKLKFDLSDLNFIGKEYRNLLFFNADLAKVNFYKTDIMRTFFHTCNFAGSDFEQTTIRESLFDNCCFNNSYFRLVNFRKTSLNNTRFRCVRFIGVDFTGTELHEVDFTNSIFEQCVCPEIIFKRSANEIKKRAVFVS